LDDHRKWITAGFPGGTVEFKVPGYVVALRSFCASLAGAVRTDDAHAVWPAIAGATPASGHLDEPGFQLTEKRLHASACRLDPRGTDASERIDYDGTLLQPTLREGMVEDADDQASGHFCRVTEALVGYQVTPTCVVAALPCFLDHPFTPFH
jgi:hypothetical protein